MTKEISTDAELMSRLLSTRPTPAECLVAAARIEQLAAALAAERAKVAKLVEALEAFPADWRERAHGFKGMFKLQAAWADGFNAARAAITEAGYG